MQIENCKLKIENCAKLIVSYDVTHLRASMSSPRVRQSPHKERAIESGRICNLPFLILNFQCVYVFALCAVIIALSSTATAQTVPDKTVATVTNGSPAVPDL